MEKNFPNLFLNLPAADLKFIREGEVVKVFDSLRKKYVVLTPEEYVRQHFVSWMRTELHYPVSLMANEVKVDLNGTSKRCDTVVFRPEGGVRIIVEYKAPDVQINQNVFDQIARYNLVLMADYLIVSNGLNHYCCKLDYKNKSYNFIPKVPDYRELVNLHSEN